MARGRMPSSYRPVPLSLYTRAQELVEFLIDSGGHVELNKRDVARAMSERYGRCWLRMDGSGDRQLVGDAVNLTRDQDENAIASGVLGGFVIAYAPNRGGLTLVDGSGDMPLNFQLHMLAGDLNRQQSHMTENRRRLSAWKAAAKNAALEGDSDLARILWQCEREIEATGLVSESLIVEYMKSLADRGIET